MAASMSTTADNVRKVKKAKKKDKMPALNPGPMRYTAGSSAPKAHPTKMSNRRKRRIGAS